MIRVLIWNEFRHEKEIDSVRAIYPNGIHAAIGEFLKTEEDIEVRYATLDEENCGITPEILAETDVLFWWGHGAHHLVPDEIAYMVRDAVLSGMGAIFLHSAHHSKPFRAIVGTNGNLSWGRNQKEIMWTLMPTHEIAAGIPDHFLLECEELYSEPFASPAPDELVFGAWFEDGHIMRAGACFRRGAGKVFYFQPGHESCRSFYHPCVQRVIENAIRWAKPVETVSPIPEGCPHIQESVLAEFDAL